MAVGTSHGKGNVLVGALAGPKAVNPLGVWIGRDSPVGIAQSQRLAARGVKHGSPAVAGGGPYRATVFGYVYHADKLVHSVLGRRRNTLPGSIHLRDAGQLIPSSRRPHCGRAERPFHLAGGSQQLRCCQHWVVEGETLDTGVHVVV